MEGNIGVTSHKESSKTMNIPGTAKQLRRDFPELWNGPSVLITIVSESRLEYFASGYFLRLGQWESPQSQQLQEALDLNGDLEVDLISKIQRCESVLIEIDDDESAKLTTIVERLLVVALDSQLPTKDFRDSIPHFDSVSATATKLPELSEPFIGAQLLDLTASAIPNRHGLRAFPLAYSQRHCRLVISQKTVLAIWEPLQTNDQLNWTLAQRWPHHCIPSFTEMYDRTSLYSGLDGVNALGLAVIERILRNEDYFLGHLEREIEFTEGQLFQAMHQKAGTIPFGFQQMVDQLANLENFLRMTRSSATRLRRRIEVSSLRSFLDEFAPTLRTTFGNALENLDEQLGLVRNTLRGSLEVLTTTSDVVRLRQELEQQRKTERFREMASGAAIAFSILSLIISGYGANLRELSPGARGSLSAIVLISSVVVFGIGIFYLARTWVRTNRRERDLQSKEKALQNYV